MLAALPPKMSANGSLFPRRQDGHVLFGVYHEALSSLRNILTMTSATSPILLKWDPKSLEIRTLTVERLLEPLVTQPNEFLPDCIAYNSISVLNEAANRQKSQTIFSVRAVLPCRVNKLPPGHPCLFAPSLSTGEEGAAVLTPTPASIHATGFSRTLPGHSAAKPPLIG
ncbi:hypothetical protein P4O66_012734 [Electrophorus voltai]|uniref:Uncharacterized protein n=1 Tax=Electrophorus voltai TaxID=2609070 RepID=A0AAD8Z4R2_9TELE|nr:hypothetical protein P4O66_012734 [Electrophorus voltai]